MGERRLRLGEILVDAGFLKPADLEKALGLQKARGLRLGQILLQENFISEPQLVQALSRRLAIPWVSLRHVDIPDELLRLVPANVAEEFFLIPVYVRRTGKGERTLFVAMNDPTDEDALRFVSASAGIAAKPMVAGPSDISGAIRLYYYGEEEIAEPLDFSPRASAPPPLPPSVKPSKRPPKPAPKKRISKPPLNKATTRSIEEFFNEEEASASKPPVPSNKPPAPTEIKPPAPTENKPPAEEENQAADQTEEPAPPATEPEVPKDEEEEKKQRMQRAVEKHMFGVGKSEHKKTISLTLLDGTTIAFGGAQKKAVDEFTKEDLIAGLRAAAKGTPMDDFLPSEKWQDYVAAILEVLLNKHLVFFEEILDEVRKSGD